MEHQATKGYTPVSREVDVAIRRALLESSTLVEILEGVPKQYVYRHVGRPIPSVLRDLTEDEKRLHAGSDFVKFEEFDSKKAPIKGIFWTQKRFDKIHKGCGQVHVMSPELAAAFERDPKRFGTLYCPHCGEHLRTGEQGHFVWDGTGERVGA